MEAGIRANQNRMNIKRAMPLKLARFWLICLFFALWACAIGVRLFWLQIVRHKEYVERAEKQQQRTFDEVERDDAIQRRRAFGFVPVGFR